MKISELPQPYRDLALMRQEQAGNAEHADADLQDDIIDKYPKCNSFIWEDSPEGYSFWEDVNLDRTPDIPSSSLAELEEWGKAKLEANVIKIMETLPEPALDYKELYEQLQNDYKILSDQYAMLSMSPDGATPPVIGWQSARWLLHQGFHMAITCRLISQ